MAIVNPLLGTVTPWNPPGNPINMDEVRRQREAEEREERDRRERAALLSNPVDRNVGPRDNTFQVGVHTAHPGFSPFSEYEANYGLLSASDPDGSIATGKMRDAMTPDEVARGYANQIGDQVKKARAKHDFWSGGLLNTITNPLAAVNNYFNHPANIASTMIAATPAGPLGGALMGAMSDYNLTKQAEHRAQAQMGTPGYSYGMLDGQYYSTAPGMFGRGIWGTVPDWFDVDMADTLENYQMGLDAEGNPTTDVGTARFSPDGYLSTPFGSDVATPDEIEALAKAYGTTYDVANNAISRANAGDGTVDENIGKSTGVSTTAQTGVTGTTTYGDEIKWDVEQGDDVDPDTDFSDMMDEEHSPW